MKKILFVITKGNWGGAQRYVYDLATHLPADTFSVRVAFGEPGQLQKKLEAAHIQTHEILALTRDISIADDIKSFFELVSLFRTIRPDVAHLNSSKAAGIGALAARLCGIPRIVFTAHGWPFLEQRNPLSKALIYLFSWLTAVLSHTVIVVSKHDLAIAERMLGVGRKTVHIYNGIDTAMTFGSGEIVRSAFPPGAHITGTIGELTKNKNQLTLIEQAKQNPELYVAIVGEGEEHSRLGLKIHEYGLQKRVKLFGFLPAEEVLRGFDAFALPSHKEGLPYVLLEAKLAGLPIEANRVGGVGEILDAPDMSEFTLEQMVQKTSALY
jgi:glycosyltransferase involved in cell wall biosynthesis